MQNNNRNQKDERRITKYQMISSKDQQKVKKIKKRQNEEENRGIR